MKFPTITSQHMREVDRLMIEEYGIQLIQMMENAGRSLAELSREMLGGDVRRQRVAVLCGGGNNGGGGMVAARHLHNWGADVYVILLASPDQLMSVPAKQLSILMKMGISNTDSTDLKEANLIIDAMIGYGLTGNPRGTMAEWIRRINDSACQVLALDIPSGLDATSGMPGNPSVHASATMTLAMPKAGLLTPVARPYVGELYLADIGVPPQLYTRLGIEMPPIYAYHSIVKIQ